ncbi:MAG: RecX family transcriptional regulator [Clostridia bacterium]|nr:RecX family transcriptional regulator [Clostridia bacterium]
MKILALQKDKLHLTKISLSNGEEVLIDNDVCRDNYLKKGDELSEEKLNDLVFESQYQRAKSRAVWYLDRKDRTAKDLYSKLCIAGFDKKASARVIARLTEVGLIDDRRFAENYAIRLMESNVSVREALQKMLQKGVPYDMAKEVLAETETDENKQIEALINKKYRTRLMADGGKEKVYAALIRKGFSYEAVKDALKNYIEFED